MKCPNCGANTKFDNGQCEYCSFSKDSQNLAVEKIKQPLAAANAINQKLTHKKLFLIIGCFVLAIILAVSILLIARSCIRNNSDGNYIREINSNFVEVAEPEILNIEVSGSLKVAKIKGTIRSRADKTIGRITVYFYIRNDKGDILGTNYESYRTSKFYDIEPKVDFEYTTTVLFSKYETVMKIGIDEIVVDYYGP